MLQVASIFSVSEQPLEATATGSPRSVGGISTASLALYVALAAVGAIALLFIITAAVLWRRMRAMKVRLAPACTGGILHYPGLW